MTIDADGPPCKCGNRGCLEALASGWAIAEDALSRIQQGEKSRVMELTRGKLENVTAQVVHSAAQQGDPLAQEVIRKAARFLGVGLANLVNIFNPERIVVGGGVARMGEMLLEPAREVVAERAFTLLVRRASIVAGELGDDAGVLGAAAFFLKTTGQAEVDPG
jgi:glucokinase